MSRSDQPKSLSQYSIRAILVLISICAAGLAIWKTFLWEPPTHKFLSYEKAQSYHGVAATIGPNTIRIESVARNDRDGSITIENGRGEKLETQIPLAQQLVDSAQWLDVVQVKLSPGVDRVKIIEVRVFDHKTRELLSTDYPRCGYQVVEPNIVQLYGLGQSLPPEIDLWFRLGSYHADDKLSTLLPTTGATVNLEGNVADKVRINTIQNGYIGWSSTDGFSPVPGDHHHNCGIELGWNTSIQWRGLPPSRGYEVTAVKTDAERLTDDRFLAFAGKSKSPIWFDCPFDQIDHLEIRPSGGRHVFFFDGLKLPSLASPAKFADPPQGVIKVQGQNVKATAIPEFKPLDIRVSIKEGRVYSGSAAGSDNVHLILRPNGPEDVGTSFSGVIDSRGLGALPYAFSMQTTGKSTWLSDNSFRSRGGWRASTLTHSIEAKTFETPLKDIDAIQVKLLPVIGN